jgi:hypothetical protein
MSCVASAAVGTGALQCAAGYDSLIAVNVENKNL